MSGENLSLGDLDQDVCNHILQELPARDLLSLSTTCRWLREACMPFLFGCCYISTYDPSGYTQPRTIPPPSLRPYVQYVCRCLPRLDFISTIEPSSLRIQDNCLFELMERSKLCDIYSGAPFAEQLRAFPRLRSVTIHTNKVTRKWHGIAWDTLRAVLSIPHLREFKLSQLHFCPTLRHGEELNVESLAPITSFHYLLHHPRGWRAFPAETAALTAVLAKLCDRLETLILMSESVSIDALARLRWPHLRKLVFYGTPWTNLSAPFVSLCSGMQSLRCLSLKLNPPPDTMIQPVWPQGFACSFPWPELERLVISYPDPQDQIYDHLPPSLHALSLRCWQHLYIQWFLYQKGVTYSPDRDMLLRASTMLSILQRCSTLALDHLEVEYRADEEEDVFLRYIATTFPHLKSLKIHRYRPAFHHEDVHPARIADALTPLAELSRLKLFLDFVPQKGQKDIVQEAAAVFAHSLTSSLHLVTIYYAHAIWRVFDVVAGCVHEQQMTYSG